MTKPSVASTMYILRQIKRLHLGNHYPTSFQLAKEFIEMSVQIVYDNNA